MSEAEHSASRKVETQGGYYVVLVSDKLPNEAPLTWQVIEASVAARSAEHAVRITAAARGGNARVFVAVPARSWQPVKVTPKVETTLLIEDVKA